MKTNQTQAAAAQVSTTKNLNFKIPGETWRKVKMASIARGETMAAVITKILNGEVSL